MAAKPVDSLRPRAPEPKKIHIADTLLTRYNWYKHVNWLNVTLIVGIPVYGCIQAFWVPLRLPTAIWATIYYFCTGLGITAGLWI
jgi:stearoyl-CoA desaturase (delta-9 desaturase)